MQTVLYFDVCSVPIFIVILITIFVRRMTKGLTNRIFIALVALSALAAVSDVIMEAACSSLPLDGVRWFLSELFTYIYFLCRNGSIYLYFFFMFSISGTWYRIRSLRRKVLISVPLGVLAAGLLTNPFTGFIFTITKEDGYSRGSLITCVYAVSMAYALAGTIYLILCRKFIQREKLIGLFSMYGLFVASAIAQFFVEGLLVEMIATSFSFLLVVLFVLRPEELSDASVGSLSFEAFRGELNKTLLTGQKIQIAAVDFINAKELRGYMGEDMYLSYIAQLIRQLDGVFRREKVFFDIYFDPPGNIYIKIDDPSYDVEDCVKRLYSEFSRKAERAVDSGERVIPRVCNILVPGDSRDIDEIVRLCREFYTYIQTDKLFVRASEIMSSRDYPVLSHIDQILSDAIREKKFCMYYQPIYSFEKGRFVSAEALIRLIDDKYGFISPGLFIPAAERKGMILPIGDFVLEDVHRFIGESRLSELGVEYIEVNLSVAQCLQTELPEKIAVLGERYGVSPDQINLEIIETTFEEVSGVMEQNLEFLSAMGYSFSLDDYGTGYSNMQRVSRLPLKIIKLDKSLVDDMENSDGMSIVRNTVRMMKDIDKEIVAEGVETRERLDELEKLGCNFIQGYYFSKPLPAGEYVEFVRKHNFKEAI